MWPWSTIRALRDENEKLASQLRAEKKIAEVAQKNASEWRSRLVSERAALAAPPPFPNGVPRDTPLAEKLGKLQDRAHVYGIPPRAAMHAGSNPAAVHESPRRESSSGTDSMAGVLAGFALGRITAEQSDANSGWNGCRAPEETPFKSGGGGDFSGGGSTGSWESSSESSPSSSSSASDSSSSSSSSSGAD